MSSSGLSAAIVRVGAGSLGGVLAGFLILSTEIFSRERAMQSFVVGLLVAVILALARGGRPLWGLPVVVLFGVPPMVFMSHGGWEQLLVATLTYLFVAAGVFLIAQIYDCLAEQGFRIGKFLVAGALLGGVYLGVTPLSLLRFGYNDLLSVSVMRSFDYLLENLFLGIAIGDLVCLGVEIVELVVPGLRGVHEPSGQTP